MITRVASLLLSELHKRQIKSALFRAKAAYVKRFRSYNIEQLVVALRTLGVSPRDVLIVHSAYSPFNGFRGSPAKVIEAFQQAIGPEGTLLMPSFPYTGSTQEYVLAGEEFDVRRTASRMGIVSEMFRRQSDTKRSCHPAHPVVARGPLASWFVEGHESCAYSCGPGSPFEKLIEVDAKALFFDVGLNSLSFIHYLEHSIRDHLPFPLYDSEMHQISVIDAFGRVSNTSVRTFSSSARASRRFSILERQLRARGMVRTGSVGNTVLGLVSIRDTLDVTRDMASRGEFFYDFSGTVQRNVGSKARLGVVF